jgi:uncharacterized protein (TIGR04255 family)
MIFPDSDRTVYKVDTIAEVICQLQFPELLSIASEPPAAFQEAIREEYPLYRRQEGIAGPPEIAEIFSQFQVAAPQAAVHHHFSTVDNSRTVTLTTKFLAISERRYTEWRDLRSEIDRSKGALEQIYRPSFYARTGLRYQNVVDRQRLGLPNASWSDLLNPVMAGYLGVTDDDLSACVQEATGNVVFQDPEANDLFVRLQHGLAIPEGDPQNLVYSIDADYHTHRQLDGGSVLDLLDRFNAEAGNLFRWSISPLLHDALGVRNGMEDLHR